jgi:NodT family efflux transporter outer membrane factor (OMF) lipoprotein
MIVPLKQTGLAALLALIASGCMTGPDYARPDIATPEDWVSEKAGCVSSAPGDITAWWTQFNDPVLDSLIARAVESNFDVRAAASRVREARAARGVVAASLLPSVNAGASLKRSQGPEQNVSGGPPVSGSIGFGPGGLSRTINIRGRNVSISHTASAAGGTTGLTISPTGGAADRTSDLFSLGFDASWEMDVFGGNRRAVEAADADLEAVVEAERHVLVSLVAEVALNYIDLRAAQNRLAITQRNIKAQSETVKLTAARYDAGLSSELDAVRARSLLAVFEGQVPLLGQQVASAIYRLGVLLGGEPGMLLAELEPAAPLPAVPAEIPVGLPSELLKRRPDIRVAERQLAAENARIGVAMADLYPKFFLTGGVSGQSNVVGSALNNANQLWSFGPSVSWPIFQGGRIRANIEVQNERQEQALIRYEQTIMQALADVETSLVSFNSEQVYRRSVQDAVSANQRAVSLANERYARGLEGFLNALQAQRDLFVSEDQLVQSESIILANLVSLFKSLGGGWDPAALSAPEGSTPIDPVEPAVAP